MKTRFWGWPVLSLAALFGLGGCQSENDSQPVLPSSPVVKTQLIDIGSSLPDWHLNGSVTPRFVSQLSFRVTGKVTERLVDVGDVVQEGQVLFKLDATDYALALEVILANIRATESEIQNAKLELDRLQKLVVRNLTSEQLVDQATSTLTVLQERLKSQLLQEKQARNQLAYTQLKSPGLGKISDVLAEKGQVVAAGSPVTTIVLDGPAEITVQVPENRLAQLPSTAQAQILGQDTPVPVTLRDIATQADPLLRTWTAHYVLPKAIPFALGQTASVHFHSTQQQVQIPNTALYEQGDFTSIWAVQDGKVHRVPVTVVKLSERFAWIAGDLHNVAKIVTLGVHQLNEGQAIRESAE